MKRWIPRLLAALVLLVLAAFVWRALAARQAQQQALAAQSRQKAEAPLELGAADLLTVQRRRLVLTVPVSGSVRAVDTALVKARVAGELQGLVLREGDSVRAGQEIGRIDPTEARARLRQAQQQADAARSQVDIGQRQYDNNRALVDQGFISATALVTSQASLAGAQSTYQAAQAATDLARKALEDTVLRSPISGQVAQRLAQAGERLAIDARVLEVVDLSRLELEALVSPAEALALQPGQSAELRLEAVPQPMAAKVVRINPSAQAASRQVSVYLAIAQDPAAPRLRQGLFLQGSVHIGQLDALALPLDAVRTDQPTPYVQAVVKGRVVHQTVQTGARAQVEGQTFVALEGLPEGTPVLAGRLGPLRAGLAVRPTAAAAPPATAPGSAP
ncbi:MAG: efflux RND transporter periplasmic adaptor subunit [Burkholderiaceae bacterium]|nr:efflux RND transporter periplasmic adaptor subunit [Burkholderiaceae bacterium]